MNFLNKDKKDARVLTIVLGILYALTFIFVNYNSSEMLIRSMGPLMGIDVSGGYFALVLIGSAAFGYLIFYLLISASYSLAYHSLVNKTRDIKAMPVSKPSFINHTQFVMIFANLIIGAISMVMRFYPIYETIVDLVVRMVVKVCAYLVVLALLTRVGVGDNVKKKIFGGFLTPLAVLIAIGM